MTFDKGCELTNNTLFGRVWKLWLRTFKLHHYLIYHGVEIYYERFTVIANEIKNVPEDINPPK